MTEPRFQHSIESVCVWWSLFSFLPSPHPPLHIFISSFFLFSKKRKRLRAQSGHSLNLVLSKCPPFNLHSLCLCYYLHPFFCVCALFPFSKLSFFLLFIFTDAHASLFYSAGSILQPSKHTVSNPSLGLANGPGGPCSQPAFLLGKLGVRMTSLRRAALPQWWGHGVGGFRASHVGCEWRTPARYARRSPHSASDLRGVWGTCGLLSC